MSFLNLNATQLIPKAPAVFTVRFNFSVRCTVQLEFRSLIRLDSTAHAKKVTYAGTLVALFVFYYFFYNTVNFFIGGIMSSGRRSNQSGTPTTPIGKKLIQARLPFKSLTPSCSTIVKPGNGDNTRKRKLSAVDDSSHKAKINRISDPSKDKNGQQLEISDDESELVPAEQVIELTSDDEPAANTTADSTEKESLPETPKARRTRKSTQKTPVIKAVTPKQSRPKSSPRSIRKHKLNVVDNVAIANEESSFSIKLPLPKKRSKNEATIVSPLDKAKKDRSVVLSTDNDDSSLSEDSSAVKSEPAADPKIIATSTSEEEGASLEVTSNEKTENEDCEMQSSPKSGKFK